MPNVKPKQTKSKQTEAEISPTPIDKRFEKLVKTVEKENPGFLAVFAGEFRYPIKQTPIEIAIAQTRKLNLLEEFILRATTDFNPPPTLKELSKVLGLDTIFVQNAIAHLSNLGHISIDDSELIHITPQGKDCYEQGIISEEPEYQTIYAITEPLEKKISLHQTALEIKTPELPNLEDIISLKVRIPKLSNLKVKKVQQLIEDSGLEINQNEDERMITHVKVTGKSQVLWKPLLILVLSSEALENKIVQVRHDKYIYNQFSDLLANTEKMNNLINQASSISS